MIRCRQGHFNNVFSTVFAPVSIEVLRRAGGSIARLMIASVLVLTATRGLAAEPFSLGGHKLGERLDTVLADSRFDCNGLSGCFLYEVCTYREADHGMFRNVPIEGLTLYFTGERLSGIEASFDEPAFQRVLATLREEYGEGEVVADDTAPENTVHIWRSGSRLLRIERLLRPNRSSVIVAERHLLSELTRR
jgi:hypothetical protein